MDADDQLHRINYISKLSAEKEAEKIQFCPPTFALPSLVLLMAAEKTTTAQSL